MWQPALQLPEQEGREERQERGKMTVIHNQTRRGQHGASKQIILIQFYFSGRQYLQPLQLPQRPMEIIGPQVLQTNSQRYDTDLIINT